MEKKLTMTLEEAIAHNKATEGYDFNNTKKEEDYIKLTLENYNYRIRIYEHSKTRILEELQEEVNSTGDDFNTLDIRFETIEDYVTNGSGTTFRPKFNAWSDKYVYVRQHYDGWTEVVSIERNPCDNLNEAIGGG